MPPTIPDSPHLRRQARRVPGVPPVQRLLRWTLSLVWTSGRYLLHRVPLFRRGRDGASPPASPDLDRLMPGDPSSLQRAGSGHGPLCHRRYRIAFTDAEVGPAALIARLKADLNAATPTELARFEPLDPDLPQTPPVAVGEEYLVHLPGPWNGPVRVIEADDTSFTFATLAGHMEAGQITFRALEDDRRALQVFEIESFARSGTRLFDLLYRRLPIGREMQLHMWASFCEAVVDLAGGVVMSSITVDTHTYPDTDGR